MTRPTLANMAWLKRHFEPENYDPDFIKASNNNVELEPVEYEHLPKGNL